MAISTTSYSPNGWVTIAGTSYRFKRYSGGGSDDYTDCLTFTGETSEFTLKATNKEWDGTVYYSTDHNTWNVWDGTAISSANKKLYLRGKGNTKFFTSKGAQLSLSAKAGCSGDIQTLLDWENPPTSISANCYAIMFSGCTSLTSAPKLSATTLMFGCYRMMFKNCASLTSAPSLPATTMAASCYESMFSGCTSLTSAPKLLATTLANLCYSTMFYGCTSLTSAPTLPATVLADYCYAGMFNNCTNLSSLPALPATTLKEYCYTDMFKGCTSIKLSTTQTTEYKTSWRIPSSGTISSEPSAWGRDMLTGTGGTFTSAPSINTTYYGAWGTSGGGGGGDTPTEAWNEVNGGAFYGGTYFLRLEPDMSLANDSTWDTWENALNSLYNTGNSDGDGFTIAFDGDADYAGYNTLGYTYYFEPSITTGGMGDLIPGMRAVDHMRYVYNLYSPNTNYDGKFLIGSYQSVEAGRSSEWQGSITGPTGPTSALSCTENAYPGEGNWLLGSLDDTSIYYPYQTEDTDYKYGTCLKQKTIKIPKFSNSSRLYSSQKVNSEGDAFKLWKTMAKLAPSKGDIINLPFWGKDEEGTNYACRVLELDGTIAKVVRLTPLNVLSGGNYNTGAFDNGNSGALYEGSSLKTAIDGWLGGVDGTTTGGEGNLNLHHALVNHDFEQVLYGDSTSSWMVSGTALSSSLQPIDKKIIANQTVRPLTLEDIVEYLGAGDENLTGDNIKTMLNNLDYSNPIDYAVLMSSHNNGVLKIVKASGVIEDGADECVIYPVAYVDLNYLFNTPLDLGWEYGERLSAHKYTLNYNAATGSDECSITVDDAENELASTIVNVTSPSYTKTINVVATNTGVTTKAIEINGVKYKFNTGDTSSVKINVINSDINIRFVDVDEYEHVGDTRSFVITFVQTDDYIAANHPEFLQ